MLKSLTLFAALCAASVAWCAKPNVIPALREWTDGAAGETYALTAASRVVIAPDACPKLEQYAKTFAQDLGRTLVKGQPAPGTNRVGQPVPVSAVHKIWRSVT